MDFSRPGKPTENAYIESFNGRVRQECLNLHWFTDMDEVQARLAMWRVEYNLERPHSSLSNLSPWEYANDYREKREVINSLNTMEIAV